MKHEGIVVEVTRMDAHPGDHHGLQTAAQVPRDLTLSGLVATVLDPFLRGAPQATWRCRVRAREHWHDVADVVAAGPAERRGSRLLVPDEAVATFVGAPGTTVQVSCRPL